jgi:isopenicillin N synthase-like dioxygenase
MIKMSWKEMQDKSVEYHQKFGQALKDGFFYVEIPNGLKHKVAGVQQFAKTIRTNETLKAAQLGDRLGYQERHGTQNVAFCALSHQWEQVYPQEIAEVAKEMNKISIEILKSALQYLSIPEEKWSLATGELTDGKGSNAFSINHYLPQEKKIGLIPHKDMGWITVLFIDKAGLQSCMDGKEWIDVPAEKDHFVINFGRAFEILINETSQLRASIHRVREIAQEEIERTSFGVFINHTEGTCIQQMDDQGSLVQKQTYGEYLNQCFAEFSELQKLSALQNVSE